MSSHRSGSEMESGSSFQSTNPEKKGWIPMKQPNNSYKSSQLDELMEDGKSSSRTISRSNKSTMSSRSYKTEKSSFSNVLVNLELVNSLVNELQQVTLASTNFQVKWENFINIKSILKKLEEEQKDNLFQVKEEIDTDRFEGKLIKLIKFIDQSHERELESEERKRRIKEEMGIEHKFDQLNLNGDFVYPEQIDLFHLSSDYSLKKGRGIRLNSDVMKGSKIFQIPIHCMMTSIDACLDKDMNYLMEGIFDITHCNPKLRLTFYLYLQKIKGISSKYQSYIDTLPYKPNSPLFYSIKDIEPFKSSYIIGDVMNQTIECARYYCNLYQQLKNKNYFDIKKFTFSSFKWCYAIVLTRSINLPLPTPKMNNFFRQCQEVALIPVADIFNFDFDASDPIFNRNTACLELIADNILYEDQEIFIKYPVLDNRELFLRYGIINEKGLPFDTIRMGINILKSDDNDSTRLKLSEVLNIPPYHYIKLQRNQLVNNNSKVKLMIAIASYNKFKLKEIETQIVKRGISGREMINKIENDEHIWDLIRQYFINNLQFHLNYSIPFSNLEKLVQSLDLNSASSFPKFWLINLILFEIKFLNQSLACFNDQISPHQS
ncbi:SET domain-containing protein [Neoconidiobolus thromboides FSU 785]|nr:SET domain-containing protein [Neoconidiobolus thromboides FSU 785]